LRGLAEVIGRHGLFCSLDAADSPVVKDRGDENQLFGGTF
jgi:hypothetical protein